MASNFHIYNIIIDLIFLCYCCCHVQHQSDCLHMGLLLNHYINGILETFLVDSLFHFHSSCLSPSLSSSLPIKPLICFSKHKGVWIKSGQHEGCSPHHDLQSVCVCVWVCMCKCAFVCLHPCHFISLYFFNSPLF